MRATKAFDKEGFYINYRYADYYGRTGNNGIQSMIDRFNADKAANIYFGKRGKLMTQLQDRKKQMVTGGSYEEYEELLSVLEDPNSLANILKTRSYQEGLGIKNISFNQAISQADVNNLASEVDTFTVALVKSLDECSSLIAGSLEAFKNKVVQLYCESRGVTAGTSAFSERVIKDFLTHQGITKLNIDSGMVEDSSLNTCLNACVLLAEALPQYGSSGGLSLGPKYYSVGRASKGKGTRRRSGNGRDTLAIIVSKAQGMFNNVVGKGGEIAWAKAEEVGLKKFEEELKKVNQTIPGFSRGKNISVETKLIGAEYTHDNAEDLKSVSKGDVQVIITDGQVTINYGASVKQYRFNSKTNAQTITLVSNTPFFEALTRFAGSGNGNLEYMLNVAAGRSGKNIANWQTSSYSIGEGELTEAWNNIVQSVTISNFLHFLAGVVDNSGTSVLYLVVNGQVIPVATIIENIGRQNIISKIHMNTSNRGLVRGSFTKLNQWIKPSSAKRANYRKQADREKGQERSNKLYSDLYRTFQNVKLTVSLKDIASFM